MKSSSILCLSAVLQVAWLSAAMAQQLDNAARLVPSPSAKLLIATEGIFELTLGKSIDVTDKKILLSFPRNFRNEARDFESGKAYLTINGKPADNPAASECCPIPIGSRIDLKRFSEKLRDRDECILDLVELNTPKGGLPTVTLRLFCP